MFKQLFSALKGSEVLDKAFAEFTQMLDHSEWMFDCANRVLARELDPKETRDTLYDRDKSVNELQRSIRRKIIRHLTVNPGVDVAASMALLSITKDAERLGDHCKNVFEVGQFYREDFKVARYHEPIEEVRKKTATLFARVKEAFVKSDADQAKEIMADVKTIRTKCDMIVEQLLLDAASIQTHEAVAYSLLARHYKRVAAHLSNIASAIGGKIEDLDFE